MKIKFPSLIGLLLTLVVGNNPGFSQPAARVVDNKPGLSQTAKVVNNNPAFSQTTAKQVAPPPAAPSAAEKIIDFKTISDVQYETEAEGGCRGDIDVPSTPGPTPAVVVVHGGKWSEGGRADGTSMQVCASLAHHGILTLNVDYRLTGNGGEFPNDVLDICRASEFLRKNAKKYHIDPDRIGVFGASAGAHLALLAAYAPDLSTGTVPNRNIHIYKCAAVYSPPTHLSLIRSQWIYVYLDDTPQGNRPLFTRASPVAYVKTGVPTYIVHGARDAIVPVAQAEELDKRLKAEGIKSELLVLPDGTHFFSSIPGPDHDKALAGVLKFFLENL